MKGIVLAGGKGKRIQSVVKGGNKCLLQLGGKSIISYNIENLCTLNEITECIVVVGHNAEDVISEVGEFCNGKKITYCVQKEQKGLINALESALPKLYGDDFFMVLGDEFILNNEYSKAINTFNSQNLSCLIGIIEVQDTFLIKKTYTVQFDDNGKIIQFVEKPDEPFNHYMGTGNVIFHKDVLNLLSEVPVNVIRGEKELVDLFNILLSKKKNIDFFKVGEKYYNINTAEDYEAVMKHYKDKVSV